jgi:hypothetical protein
VVERTRYINYEPLEMPYIAIMENPKIIPAGAISPNIRESDPGGDARGVEQLNSLFG